MKQNLNKKEKKVKCTCGLQTKKNFRANWDFIPCEYCRKQGR